MKRYILFLLVVILLMSVTFFVFFLLNSESSNAGMTNKTSLYHDQAMKVCQMLNQSVALYQVKRFKQAHTLAENAYWNVYDNILEIKYRPYVTPEVIFNVEDQFHQFSNAVLSSKNPKNVKQQADALCQAIKQQAVFLTEKG